MPKNKRPSKTTMRPSRSRKQRSSSNDRHELILSSVRALIEKLSCDDDDYRSTVASALGQIGDAAVASLLDAIGHEDSRVRAGASEALGFADSEGKTVMIVAALVRMSGDSDDKVRLAAIQALGNHVSTCKLGSKTVKDAVGAIVMHLQDPQSHIRKEAADSLASFGPQAISAAPALIGFLDDSDDEVRSAAAMALGCICSDE